MHGSTQSGWVWVWLGLGATAGMLWIPMAALAHCNHEALICCEWQSGKAASQDMMLKALGITRAQVTQLCQEEANSMTDEECRALRGQHDWTEVWHALGQESGGKRWCPLVRFM